MLWEGILFLLALSCCDSICPVGLYLCKCIYLYFWQQKYNTCGLSLGAS